LVFFFFFFFSCFRISSLPWQAIVFGFSNPFPDVLAFASFVGLVAPEACRRPVSLSFCFSKVPRYPRLSVCHHLVFSTRRSSPQWCPIIFAIPFSFSATFFPSRRYVAVSLFFFFTLAVESTCFNSPPQTGYPPGFAVNFPPPLAVFATDVLRMRLSVHCPIYPLPSGNSSPWQRFFFQFFLSRPFFKVLGKRRLRTSVSV